MVKEVRPNGRLSIVAVGTWPSRFAEGARVTVFCDSGPLRGTVLPKRASGHIFGDLVDSQPGGWERLELRVDAGCDLSPGRLKERIAPGDFVAFDAMPEITSNGYVNARHLDDKAGVAVLLAVARSIVRRQAELPVDCHLIFTIFEEVGSGASSAVYGDVAEMVVIDNAPVGPGQNAIENGATIAMMDLAGPFDYHLSRKLLRLCRQHDIVHARDVFRHYRSDSASAIEAGNDTRTALAGFGVDASHGYERAHLSSLIAVARLAESFIQSKPTFDRDKDDMTSLTGFPHQPVREIIKIRT
jgi:peptidase M42 family hydrolase